MLWSQEELITLKEKYSSHSIQNLSKILNRSENSIYSKASKLKLSHLDFNRDLMREKSRKYGINHHYFDEIDSEDKAYFLGILFADGYNYEKCNHISLGLQEKDKELLIRLNHAIENERPLFHKVDTREGRSSTSHILSFSSHIISKRLAELGCPQNKTDLIVFPQYLPHNLRRHFIRGYFDGDGSIIVSTGKSNNYTKSVIKASVVGNGDFISELFHIVAKETSYKSTSVIQDKRRENVYSLIISGHKRTQKFLAYLYADSNMHMERKKNLYKAIDIVLNEGILRGKELVFSIKQKQKDLSHESSSLTN